MSDDVDVVCKTCAQGRRAVPPLPDGDSLHCAGTPYRDTCGFDWLLCASCGRPLTSAVTVLAERPPQPWRTVLY
jgi:hypothetical protein